MNAYQMHFIEQLLEEHNNYKRQLEAIEKENAKLCSEWN